MRGRKRESVCEEMGMNGLLLLLDLAGCKKGEERKCFGVGTMKTRESVPN